AEIDNIPGAELLRQGYLKDKYLIKRPKNFSYVVGDIKNLTAEEYDHIVNAYKTANASIPSSELLDITISGFRRSDGFFYVYSPMTILVTFADDSKISLLMLGYERDLRSIEN
ncbi:hypothetical protein ACMZ6Z_09495, partial [Streptococcus pluranimalium]|uniref:hypothetical protein n=1 Tax=Streptococcus pluranimalium TaxID=82348 RepID=UPI0039FD2D9A